MVNTSKQKDNRMQGSKKKNMLLQNHVCARGIYDVKYLNQTLWNCQDLVQDGGKLKYEVSAHNDCCILNLWKNTNINVRSNLRKNSTYARLVRKVLHIGEELLSLNIQR